MPVDHIPIHHLSSHARAGETLCLKLLQQHPQIHVPLQITKEEDPAAQNFVQWIRESEPQTVPLTHPYVSQLGLTKTSVIAVKQGVWAPQTFTGVGLIRNPLAFVSSLLEYNKREGLGLRLPLTQRLRYAKTFQRLQSWAARMDPLIHKQLKHSHNIIDALCLFYNYRVTWIRANNAHVFHYEDLITNTVPTLTSMCNAMGVNFDPCMLHAHESYKGVEGHGTNNLSRPLDTKSLHNGNQLPAHIKAQITRATSGM
jgi:hypothetical protein